MERQGMQFSGVLVNAAGVFVSGLLGALLGKHIPERVRSTVMTGIGLCVLYVGLTRIGQEGDFILVLLSIAGGGALGAALDIDSKLGDLGLWLQKKLSRENGTNRFAEAFVATTLFVCVGAMSVVAAMESGMQGQNDTFYAKALVDSVAVLFMASSLGYGCALAGLAALVYQGLLVVCAGLLAPLLSGAVIAQMSCVGALLILAIGLNVLGISKIKIGNFMPAVFLPILLQPLLALF